MTIQLIALWLFPKSDFAAWQALVGETELTSYEEYLDLLDGMEDVYAVGGIEVVRVPLTVEQMIAELSRRRLRNSKRRATRHTAGALLPAASPP